MIEKFRYLTRLVKYPFKWMRRKMLSNLLEKLDHINHVLDRVDRQNKAGMICMVRDCVSNKEHRELLYVLIQGGLDFSQVIINSSKSCIDTMYAYLSLVRPATFTNLIRVGSKPKHGYVLDCGYALDCGHVMYPPPPLQQIDVQPKAVSLGVSPYSPWDLEMAEKGYLVLQYDASIDRSPDLHENIIFHKKFFGKKIDDQTVTLEQIMRDYSFDPHAHNILQINIKGTEWDVFEDFNFKILEMYFAQIIIKFHCCDPRAFLQSKRQIAILEKFHNSFQPIHLHYANCCSRYFYIQDRFFCDAFEVSYLRRDLLPNDITLRDTCGDIEGLDYPNFEALPNIPIHFT